MYCTVKFSKKINSNEYDFLQNLFNENLKYKYSNNNIKSSYHKYNYENFEFTLSEDKLSGNGSVTKLFFGNNVKNASFLENKIALRRIEDFLKISLKEATIDRIDVALTLNLKDKPNKYLRMITPPVGFKPEIKGNHETIYLKKGGVTYSFYDKNLETFKKREYKNLCKKDDYKLRYEVQINNPSQILSKTNLTWFDLSTPEIYRRLVDYWYSSFQSIPIICQESVLNLNFKNLKKLKNDLEVYGIAKLGGVDVVQQAVKCAHIDKSARCYINKYLNQIEIPALEKNILKVELDEKINEAYQLYRQC